MEELARVLIYGDLHLSSKNYGAHNNYPKDSLNSLKYITEYAEKYKATHIVGLGDLTFGRFHTLEYRADVEEELRKQLEICNGNRFELKGNHDSASYGMTEYDFYIEKGLIRPATNFTVGNVHFTLVNNGETATTEVNINASGSNFVLMHDYFKFSDSNLPDYGKAIILDNFTKWYGVDHVIGGHIHNSEVFEGLMTTEVNGQTFGKRVTVDYVGSMSRPSYREGHTDELGHIVIITVYDTGEYKYDRLDIQLPSLAETFNLTAKEAEKAKKAEKGNRVDISDIVHRLDAHERSIGNPEDIIAGLVDVDEKYKAKAIELLKIGIG